MLKFKWKLHKHSIFLKTVLIESVENDYILYISFCPKLQIALSEIANSWKSDPYGI